MINSETPIHEMVLFPIRKVFLPQSNFLETLSWAHLEVCCHGDPKFNQIDIQEASTSSLGMVPEGVAPGQHGDRRGKTSLVLTQTGRCRKHTLVWFKYSIKGTQELPCKGRIQKPLSASSRGDGVALTMTQCREENRFKREGMFHSEFPVPVQDRDKKSKGSNERLRQASSGAQRLLSNREREATADGEREGEGDRKGEGIDQHQDPGASP